MTMSCTQFKAVALILLLCGSEARRISDASSFNLDHSQHNARRNGQSNSVDQHAGNMTAVAVRGILETSVYAAGNCQFLPVMDVATFLASLDAPAKAAGGAARLARGTATGFGAFSKSATAITAASKVSAVSKAAAGVGVLSKPLVTGTANGVMQMGTKAGGMTKVFGAAVGMATPIGIAFNVLNIAMTGYQIYQLHQILQTPGQLCLMMQNLPPFSTGGCPALAMKLGGKPPPPPAKLAGLMAEVVSSPTALAAIALIAAGAGAFWLWQRKTVQKNYNNHRCPKSIWERDPWGKDATMSPYFQQLENRGMPHVREGEEGNLTSVRMPTFCGAQDVECFRASCEQSCCSRKWCTFYQFRQERPGLFGGKDIKWKCYLGKRVSFELQAVKMWGGEMLVDAEAAEDDAGMEADGDHTAQPARTTVGDKVSSKVFVEDQRLIQQIWGMQRLTNVPKGDDEDDKMSSGPCTKGKHRTGLCLAKRCREACAATEDCKFYQYQTGRDACWYGPDSLNAIASMPDTYSTYQTFGGVKKLETERHCAATVKEDETFFCPTTGECTQNCAANCEGYMVDVKSTKAGWFTESYGGRCERHSSQDIVSPEKWISEYHGSSVKVDSVKNSTDVDLSTVQCTGLRKQVVQMTEETSQLGALGVCREACVQHSECVLYQIHSRFVKLFDKGMPMNTRITCWLGLVDANFHPLFQCVKPAAADTWSGEYIDGGVTGNGRGCQSGGFACPLSGECVESCSAQCPSYEVENQAQRICDGTQEEEDEFSRIMKGEFGGDNVMEDAGDEQDEASDNEESAGGSSDSAGPEEGAGEKPWINTFGGPPQEGSAGDELSSHPLEKDPVLDYEDEDDDEAFYLEDPSDMTYSTPEAKADTIMMIKTHKKKLIASVADAPFSMCDSLNAGAYGCELDESVNGCKCKYLKPQQAQCLQWFQGANHVRPVVMARGLMLFAGKDCSCAQEAVDSYYVCQFKLMGEIPPIKMSPTDAIAIRV